MIVDELVAILGFDVRGEGELRKFNQGLDGAERKARSFSSTLVALGGAAVAALGGLAIGRQVGCQTFQPGSEVHLPVLGYQNPCAKTLSRHPLFIPFLPPAHPLQCD